MSKWSGLPSAIVPLTPAAMNSCKLTKASRSGISQQVVPSHAAPHPFAHLPSMAVAGYRPVAVTIRPRPLPGTVDGVEFQWGIVLVSPNAWRETGSPNDVVLQNVRFRADELTGLDVVVQSPSPINPSQVAEVPHCRRWPCRSRLRRGTQGCGQGGAGEGCRLCCCWPPMTEISHFRHIGSDPGSGSW